MIDTGEGILPVSDYFIPTDSSLPPEALNFFESDIKRLASVDVSPIYCKKFEDGSQTYLARAKGIHDGGEGRVDTLDSLYVFDVIHDEFAGYAIATLHSDTNDADMADRPFVDFTKTFPSYGGINLGRKRLITLNEATQQFFNLPLHASRVISDRAKEIWDQLEQEGLAMQDRGTYRFKTSKD